MPTRDGGGGVSEADEADVGAETEAPSPSPPPSKYVARPAHPCTRR